VRFTFGPIVFTGREPLCSSTSRTRKSESPNIYGINKTTSRFVLHLSSSKDNESNTMPHCFISMPAHAVIPDLWSTQRSSCYCRYLDCRN
jgi:hypothetical protein